MKVCVIGTGKMGKNHARVYNEIDGVDLVGVSDINEKAGKDVAKKNKCEYFKNYEDLLRVEGLEAVSVCVPTFLHYDVGKKVIESGKHLLIEKPLAENVKKAKELVKLAEEKGVKLAVGHIERFNPAVQELKKLIVKGSLGNITSILARRVGIFPPRIKDANVIVDMAVHDIDIFRYLLGKDPEKIHAAGGKAIVNDREDYADIFLKYNGTNGLIEVNWITPVKIRVLNVTGTKGYAKLNYITQDLTLHESVYERNYDKFGDFVLQFGEPREVPIKVKKSEPLRLELQNFIDAVKKGKDPLVSGNDGLEVLKITESIMKSIGSV